MSKSLTTILENRLANGHRIIVPYIMAGDHENGLDGLLDTITLLSEAGAAAIEIGIPFSDPVADGPVIEAAGLRSLAKGVTLADIIKTLKTIDSPVPLVMMTYLNPLYQYGLERVVTDLKETSVKGLIIPDLPHEHTDLLKPLLEGTDLAVIPLVSLTTGLERQKTLVASAEGFVYAVAINGVTGKTDQYREDLDKHLATLTELSPIPVLTGFGVSTQADVNRFNKVSSGVIVGSKIVKDLYEGKHDDVKQFVQEASCSVKD
ncbi:tryptophan synthase subunit alpha [Streptococcus moroccensis]|uniref:Tryptophan synthase alpha chain n=1 Tax=Streptococcus moroccensis TaxID=1451356 RepID=A0ABT9YQK2_9STRE|nr:tryptophan synthase subunit alpha [Streptococcus moroccensis]MDQ0222271.1 tryptophan synthase alpha chain [Streptococcus moroccensis]